MFNNHDDDGGRHSYYISGFNGYVHSVFTCRLAVLSQILFSLEKKYPFFRF